MLMKSHCMSAALAALALSAVQPLAAQTDPGRPAQGQPVHIDRDSAAGRVVSFVYQGPVAYVRIETSEPGAEPNEHPDPIEAASLRAALAQVRIAGRSAGPLLTAEELDEICAPLATALGRASPGQDVSFAVSGRHGILGPLAPREVTTGRVFRRDGRLQLIAGLVHRDFDNQFRGTGELIAFEPGRRAGRVEPGPSISVPESLGTVRRTDWVALAPAPAAPITPPPTVAPPLMAPAPAPAAVAPPPATDADAIYRRVAERMKALKKLLDEGLISQQEYEARRSELLRDL